MVEIVKIISTKWDKKIRLIDLYTGITCFNATLFGFKRTEIQFLGQ